MCYSVDDLLPVCLELNIPLVVCATVLIYEPQSPHNIFSHSLTIITIGSKYVKQRFLVHLAHQVAQPSIHPLSTLIPLINATWLRKGIKPKQHLSSPRPGCENGSVMEKRAHSDRCYTLPDELVLPGGDEVEVDLMIEVSHSTTCICARLTKD